MSRMVFELWMGRASVLVFGEGSRAREGYQIAGEHVMGECVTLVFPFPTPNNKHCRVRKYGRGMRTRVGP